MLPNICRGCLAKVGQIELRGLPNLFEGNLRGGCLKFSVSTPFTSHAVIHVLTCTIIIASVYLRGQPVGRVTSLRIQEQRGQALQDG